MINHELGKSTDKNVRLKVGLLAASGLLAVAGCSAEKSSNNDQEPVNAPSSSPAPEQGSSSNTPLTFDSLGGTGSTVIRVYPGADQSVANREANGTYYDGDTVVAECKKDGRLVQSDTSLGEVDRSSNQWIKISGTPDETQLASAVYVEQPQQLLRQLPNC